RVRYRQELFQQLLASRADSDHADANAITCAEHTGRRVGEQCRRTRSRLDKITPRIFCHISSHEIASLLPYQVPLSFQPSSQLLTLRPFLRHASGFPDSRRNDSHPALEL